MIQPKVSVITVVLNDLHGFRLTAASILEQEYTGLEWIIIDGGSTDGTIDEIRKLSENIAWWVSEPDKGFYDAMNKGLRQSTGEWVNFMNAGDRFAGSNVVCRVMAMSGPDDDVVYGDSYTAYAHTTSLRRAGTPTSLKHGMNVCHQSVFIRTQTAKRSGFDLSFAIGADFDMLQRLIREGCRFRQLPFAVSVSDPTGVSNRKMYRSAAEHYKILRKYQSLTMAEHLKNRLFIGYTWVISRLYAVIPESLMHRAAASLRRKSDGKD